MKMQPRILPLGGRLMIGTLRHRDTIQVVLPRQMMDRDLPPSCLSSILVGEDIIAAAHSAGSVLLK
jgi:hypothetical protein